MSDKNAMNDLISMKFGAREFSMSLITNLKAKYLKFKMAD